MLIAREDFDGITYEPDLDYKRLSTQLQRVYNLMADGKWRTLSQVQAKVGGSEAGVSARIRDLRKPKFGGYTVERKRMANLYWYRLLVGQVEMF